MANNPAWHNIFRYIVLKPDNITFEADTYKDTLNIVRGPGVNWGGASSNLDLIGSTGLDQFMINVDYDISVPVSTTDLTLEDVNGNTSSITFTAGRGVEIIRNSAQELEWRSYSVTETDTLQTVTERNNITNNKIFVNDIEVGTISSSFTEDGFPSYDAGHDLAGDGTLDNPLKFSPLYKDSLIANSSDQFEFTALGPGVLAYDASYVFDTGATTGSVTLEREDPSSPGTWVTLDNITGVTLGYSYAIQGIYAELYGGNVNYRLTYSWTGNLGIITWHVYNTFEGGAYSPIISPQLKTDTDAKTVDINDLQFFQNNIRTTVSNTDIVLDPAGTGKVIVSGELLADRIIIGSNIGIGDYTTSGTVAGSTLNIAIGNNALESSYISGGDRNIAIGGYALNGGNNRFGNVVIGDSAVSFNFSGDGSENVVIGYLSTPRLTSGEYNVILGSKSATQLTTGSNNVAIGYQSLYSDTTRSNTVAVGYQSLYSNAGGDGNTAIGYRSLRTNNTGNYNTAVGQDSLYSNSTGYYNSAFGILALYYNDTGINNTAIGSLSLYSGTTGNDNTALGYRALRNNNGSSNTAIGSDAGYGITTGNNNTAIGYQAGNLITTGTNNVILGYDSDVAANNDTNSIVIGYQVTGGGSNTIVIGNSSHTTATIKGALTADSIQNTPIGTTTRAAGNFTDLNANGNTTIGDADTDTITVGGSFVNGTILRSSKTNADTFAIAAYDVNDSVYRNLITLTASNTPTIAITSNGVGTLDNITIGGTTAAAGTFTTSTASQIVRSGNVSASAWGTTGVGIRTSSGIFTDTTTPNTGTAANAHINVLSQPTIAASNSITVTNAATLYIANAPTNGTNVTAITNPYALYVAAGAVYFAGAGTMNSSLTVNGALTVSGSNAAINMSPTGVSGTITMNPAGGGSLDNFNVGSTTRGSGAFTTLAANNTTTLQQITEILNTKTGATGTVNHDYSTGDIWYHSSISANFTVNLTNVPTTNDRTIVVTLILNQGVAGFYPNVLQIAATPVTIRWANNVTPTPSTSKIDVATFTLIRTGSTWYALGNYTTYA